MLVFWTDRAWECRGGLSAELQQAAESEIPVMFTDAIPSSAVLADPAGALLLELPCGVEVVFERVGDGVMLLSLR